VRSDPTSAEPERFESIEAVFTALEGPLLGYARRLLESDEMAEDVVQEAFLRLHAHYDVVRDPRRWLYRTVHNLSLNQLRKDGRVRPLVTAAPKGELEHAMDLTDPQPLPDEQIAREEGIGQVRLGLAALDDRSRELLRLKFEEDLSYKDMSSRTGLTVGHVGYLLHHAIKALAVELTKTGVVP
jgi:RNA polymerase sigma-70 factor (ECF subfamily)